MSVYDWNTNASSNTSVGGVSIAEGMNPAGVNNAMREIMAAVAAFSGAPAVSDLATAEATTFKASIKTINLFSYSDDRPGVGGGPYRRAASEPSHAGKFQDAGGVWFEVVPVNGGLDPLRFGAVGDGSTDDQSAFQDCIDTAATLGCNVILTKLHGLGAPVGIGDSSGSNGFQDGVFIIGNRGWSEVENPAVGVVKVGSSWTSTQAAIEIGDHTTAEGQIRRSTAIGSGVKGVWVDGNNKPGHGISVRKSGLNTISECYVEKCPAKGIRLQDNFYPRIIDNKVRQCGTNGVANTGGIICDGYERTQSDGILSGNSVINVYNVALQFSPQQENLEEEGVARDVKWMVIHGEYGALSDETNTPFAAIWVNGVNLMMMNVTWSVDDYYPGGGMIIGTSSEYGDSNNTNIAILGGSINAEPNGANPGIELRGNKIGNVSIDYVGMLGPSQFIDTTGATINGRLHIGNGNMLPDGALDITPDTDIENVRGGVVGIPPGGDPETGPMVIRPKQNSTQVHVGARDGSGDYNHVVFDSTRLGMNDLALRFPARTGAPSSPIEGDVYRADRVNWDPRGLGSGGSYLVWYNGSAWRLLSEQ